MSVLPDFLPPQGSDDIGSLWLHGSKFLRFHAFDWDCVGDPIYLMRLLPNEDLGVDYFFATKDFTEGRLTRFDRPAVGSGWDDDGCEVKHKLGTDLRELKSRRCVTCKNWRGLESNPTSFFDGDCAEGVGVSTLSELSAETFGCNLWEKKS